MEAVVLELHRTKNRLRRTGGNHDRQGLFASALPGHDRLGPTEDLFLIDASPDSREALGLTWERVDRSRGVILLEVTKSGRRREVPLNSEADAVLVRRGPRDSGLVFGTTSWYVFRSYWEKASSAAKIDDFRFHDLRHTFASWAVQRGATLQEVKDLLGHSSLAMVMRYAHLSPEHLRRAVGRLDGLLSAPASAHEANLERDRPAVQPTVSP